ncbi:MAG: uncharacterized protein H6R26_1409 [Proteobacteria bacterium]|nr:uncharacterized protein [Pseudomonadota bacterium]
MTEIFTALLILAAAGIGLYLVSLIAEALRPAPEAPTRLRWAPDIPIRHAEVRGLRLRYIQAGQGPNLVLLHTLRTQLDLFEKVVPRLAERFTVHAVDLPGHGFSDIPDAQYDAQFFADAVEGFLDAVDVQDATLAGVSIGGSLSLIVAARHNPRVVRAIAINPYDYAQGRGMARSSLLARLVVASAAVPILGETVMRLRTYFVMKNVLEGGVADPRSIPPQLLKEMYGTGNRKGHYRAFIRLLRHAGSWQTATKDYPQIRVPTLFIWGDRDWATPEERTHDLQLVPDAEMTVVEHGGHFLPLDRPDEFAEHLQDFCRRHPI